MYKLMRKNARSSRDEPIVAVGSGGAVYLNAFAMREHFKDVQAVTLLHDEDSSKLAIKPAKPGEANAFRLNFSNGTASTGVIAARSVVKQIGLSYDKDKLNYRGEWNPKLGMLEVDLKSVQAKRRKKQ